jgi:hypothetical protein
MAIMRPLGLGWGVSFWSGEESGVGVCFLDTVVVGDHHHHHHQRLEFRFGERRMVHGKRFPYAQVSSFLFSSGNCMQMRLESVSFSNLVFVPGTAMTVHLARIR